MNEYTWQAVPGFKGYYEINMRGMVRGVDRQIKVNRTIRKVKARYLTTRINNCGYVEVRFCRNGKRITKFIHHLLAEVFIPNINNKPFINHLNGIKTDNRLCNLEWVTHSENMIHAYANGLIKKEIKKVIDTCADIIYDSLREASICNNVNYFTLKNYLNGSRHNPTCLEYKQAG